MERRCEHDGYGGTLYPTSPDVVIELPGLWSPMPQVDTAEMSLRTMSHTGPVQASP